MLPATPIAGTDNDQSLYIHNAMRMLDGQVIYRDFFQFTPPGTELVYLVLLRLFGVRAWIPNALLIGLGLSLIWLCVFISQKVLDGRAAYIPALCFLTLAFHYHLDASHHWFSVLAIIASAALIVTKRSLTRLAGAGALCALASFFTQPRGVLVLVGIALFLWWEHRIGMQPNGPLWQSETVLASAFITATAVLNLYFVWAAGWRRFLWCTVTFGIRYYPAESDLNSWHAYMAYIPRMPYLRHVPNPAWLFLHALLPLVYLLFFARFWQESKKKPEQPWGRLMLLNLMGFFLFVGIAPAPVYWRLCVVSLPAFIILVWFVNSPARLHTLARQVLWACMVAAMMGFVWHDLTRWRAYLVTPTGRAAFLDSPSFQEFRWLAAHTRPSAPLFDCSGQSYFLLNLRSPAMVSFLSGTDYLRPEQVRDLVESLEKKRVPIVLWCSDLDFGLRPDDHLGPLRDYLHTHYQPAEVPENPKRVLQRIGAR